MDKANYTDPEQLHKHKATRSSFSAAPASFHSDRQSHVPLHAGQDENNQMGANSVATPGTLVSAASQWVTDPGVQRVPLKVIVP
jgi:hypothetical protein